MMRLFSAFLVCAFGVVTTCGFAFHLPPHATFSARSGQTQISAATAVADESSAASTEAEVLQSILSSKDETTYHSLSDLRSYRSWDFSWPTITKPHRFTERHTYASDKAFFAALQAHNYGLSFGLLTAVGAIDDVNSVVLYGGALVDIVTKREKSIRDFDFRLVGQEYVDSPDKCVEAAKNFVRNIFSYLKKENERIEIANQQRKLDGKTVSQEQEGSFDLQKVKIMRAQSTLTVIVPGRGWYIGETTLQFTFAPHSTVEDLLASCTPHCTRLAVKDNAVVMDAAAKYCLESLCIVLDTNSFKHASCDDETAPQNGRPISADLGRMIKYYEQKGFDVVLPGLDMSKLPVRNLQFEMSEALDLPEFIVSYDEYDGKKIMADEVWLAEKKSSQHQFGNDASSQEFDAAKFIHHNVRCLVADVYDQFYFFAEGEAFDAVFDYAPQITPRMLDKVYELVKKKHLSPGSVNVNKVQRYFSSTTPTELLDRILMDPLRDIVNDTSGGSFAEAFRFDDKAIDKLINKEKAALETKIASIRDVLVEKGLDSIVMDWPTDVSSKAEILEALYGDYLLQSFGEENN